MDVTRDWDHMFCDNEALRDGLERARSLIDEPQNWVKSQYRLPNMRDGGQSERYCAIGAIDAVLGTVTVGGSLLRKALYEQLPANPHSMSGHYSSVETFNDDINTKHADVIDLYDRAIKATVDEKIA